VKLWDDEESDIKVPFAIWTASIGYVWWASAAALAIVSA
jgi:hypothetical protein